MKTSISLSGLSLLAVALLFVASTCSVACVTASTSETDVSASEVVRGDRVPEGAECFVRDPNVQRDGDGPIHPVDPTAHKYVIRFPAFPKLSSNPSGDAASFFNTAPSQVSVSVRDAGGDEVAAPVVLNRKNYDPPAGGYEGGSGSAWVKYESKQESRGKPLIRVRLARDLVNSVTFAQVFHRDTMFRGEFGTCN